MASQKTKRRLLHKRWERRVQRRVEAVTRRLMGEGLEIPEVARFPNRLNGIEEALNDGMTYSFGYNLYASQPSMSAVVYRISGV